MRQFASSIHRIIVGMATALMFTTFDLSFAIAETLRVRAGEHDGFSRIVLDLTVPAGWSLGRDGNAYVLTLDRNNVEFDLSRIYRMIPRDRIADLVQTGNGTLRFSLDCDCHANAFMTADGSVVIDIADGSPNAASPFETPIATPQQPEDTARLSPHPEIVAPNNTNALRPLATQYGQAAPDPRLALFWRGVVPSPSAQSTTEESPAGTTFHGRPAAIVAPAPDAISEPIPDGGTAEPFASADTAPQAPMLSVPALPDPRVTTAQNDLFEQLSRAAAQGLIEVDRDRIRLRKQGPAAASATKVPVQHGTTEKVPGLHSETVIDRDSKLTETRAPVTSTGDHCIGGNLIDVGAWGDARPAPQQIAERRATLVGELDRPSRDAVLSLARLYIFLGFGAEAQAVLSAFDDKEEPILPLQEIGLILDGYEIDASGTLPGMTSCETPAAMWAVLARDEVPPGADIDESAVLRAFSALPPHLRRHLGPGLSRRLLSVGATSSARAIRNAVARIPGDSGAALSMMDGRLHLANGDPRDAEAMLDPVAASNDPLAIEALILSIETRLDRNETVESAMADAAAALAYERKGGPDGPVLARLHVLARGASEDFAAAFDAFRHWPGTAADGLRGDTISRLFSMLAGTSDEALFLTTYFQERDLLTSVADDAVRIRLAERLSDAGFGGEARDLLAGDASRTEEGRVALAKAALAEFEPKKALSQIAGLQGHGAVDIRARAFAMSGDHLAAAKSLEVLGQTELAALAAWRGGDWIGAADATPDAIRRALRDFGFVEGNATPVAEVSGVENADLDLTGELARGRALLADSQSARSTLNDLLSATAQADP